ncbi:hypothetical protein VTH06DRAFT_7915 [Thermothelomyces fergusii]
MDNLDGSSSDLFAGMDGGLDVFDLGDAALGDSGLAGDFGDGALGSSDPISTAPPPPVSATATTTTAAETISPIAGGTLSDASPDVTGPSHPRQQHQHQHQHQHQPSFFEPATTPQWAFQNTPPYDSPINPFGTAPQPTWELPLNLSKPPQSQQQSSSYPQVPTAATNDPNPVSATSAGDVSLAPAFAPNSQPSQPEHPRVVQNTLTPAQRERLKSIAMPPHLQYHSPQSNTGSPESASSGHDKATLSSPDPAAPAKPASRKRKSSASADDDDDEDEVEQPVKKTAHNMIEKRYRTNLNDKIAALRDSVPSLRIMSKSARGEDTTEDREELHGLTPAHKLNKATVLSKATEYIRHLEKRNNRLLEENSNMQARIAAFEKLFLAGAMSGQLPNPLQPQPVPMQYPQDPNAYLNTPIATPRGPDPPGMIPIPEDMKRIIAAQQMNAGRPYPVPAQPFGPNPTFMRQQQLQQQQQQAQAQSGRWNPYLGKLMVGSLAGLMLVEALVESEPADDTTDARGLGLIPSVSHITSFVRSTHVSVGGYYISAIRLLAKLRLLSLLGFVFWLACSSFGDMSALKPSDKSKSTAAVVKAAPSLASPIHVRRQAWLTAIQTVWVPRHNFFLEAAALLLKTWKYTLRNLVGSHSYLMLAGLSEEQEAARVKAWSIALDAQLAGGDVEINKSRLTLTLIASGTLPDTPLRLMLKALHIRVLLWQLNGASRVADMIAARLARSRWNEARQLNRILNSLPQGEASADDALPEHLAALIEQDCDEVLTDAIIQRAHNLAWNLHTTHNVVGKVDGMDTVVEDAAVRSPMDAVAAWYSCLILHRVLLASLRQPHDDLAAAPAPRVEDDIALAAKVAPIGSNAQVRALVARAVFAEGARGSHIGAALQALGPSVNPDKHLKYCRGVPSLIDSSMTSIMPDPDAQMALRCAMGIAQLQKFAHPPTEAYRIISSILPACANVEKVSLLGYAAAFRLMETLNQHPVARETCPRSLEGLAGSLRIWMGRDPAAGEKLGVDTALRNAMIKRCLAVVKSVVGAEIDQGYGSMDECAGADGEAEGGC